MTEYQPETTVSDNSQIDERSEAPYRLAEKHRSITISPGHPIPILEHFGDYNVCLSVIQHHFAEIAESELLLPYAGEWLLDNYYVIQRALQMVKEDMPPGYYRTLPKLNQPEVEGLPRVYVLACALIDSLSFALPIEEVITFCNAYQRVTPLQIGEIWALPTMLRARLLERIFKALYDVAELDLGLPEAILAPDLSNLSSADVVANGIRNVHALSHKDWNAFFEAVSLVEAELRTDPANIYIQMDDRTRNHYREAVERIARLMSQDELAVAQKAVTLARQSLTGLADRPRASAQGPGYQAYVGHVGYYLVDDGVRTLQQHIGHQPNPLQIVKQWAVDHRTSLYLGAIAIVTISLLVLMGVMISRTSTSPASVLAALLLAALPISTAALQLIDWFIMQLHAPRLLPRLAFDEGIPDECRTFIVMPVLISSREDIEVLFDHLEMHYLRNREQNLYFALLADFADAPQERMPEDATLVDYARECLHALNDRYPTSKPFYFFLRHRRWNPKEQTWMGWERKRGKLAMFNQLLRNPSAVTDYHMQLGDLSILSTIRYVITLDADTILPADSARELIGTMAHPLNRAVYDAENRAVTRGYSVLQPRVEILQIATQQSIFTQLFAGDKGLDLYTLAVSNLYQDVFGDAIYVGKGIYDIAAFEHVLAGGIPENTLLSHDLLEGAHGRVGLVTDVALIEDYPTHYLAHQQRVHRWIRGDWQLLPWLLKPLALPGQSQAIHGLSAINRWKLFDNLRRSLFPVTLVLLFICAWLGLLPGSQTTHTTILWSAFGLMLSFSPFIGAFLGYILSLPFTAPSSAAHRTFRNDLIRWALSVAFLLYESAVALDAVVITLYRMVRQRHLLQWTTAAHINRLLRSPDDEDTPILERMSIVPISVLIILLVILIIQPQNIAVASPFLSIWALSPLLAKYISRRIPEKPSKLTDEDRRVLRLLARRTWLYFEEFVGPASHWLPPDHYRESPRARTMYSTSPTNIGLTLLATLTAYDLGYLGAQEMALRLRLTFSTLDKLERHRGHFLNWYDAQSLQPLAPRYVSTVDSGNLVGCLIALRQGLHELADQPVIGDQRWQGLLDLLGLLDELIRPLSGKDDATIVTVQSQIAQASTHPAHVHRFVTQLHEVLIPQLGQSIVTQLDTHRDQLSAAKVSDIRLLLARLRHHATNLQRDVDMLLPWAALIRQPPDTDDADAFADIFAVLATMPALADAVAAYNRVDELIDAAYMVSTRTDSAKAWLDTLRDAVGDARTATHNLILEYDALDRRLASCIAAHDFSFLFDSERYLFHIGYNLSNEQLDNSYYDLLASEARIASYVALIKGDIPQEHWLYLGRPMTASHDAVTLLSWTGTMFEYLMPALLMRDYPNSLLHQSYTAVVDQQIGYARERNVPWGISESGYYALDSNLNYQYRAFGIPQLAFKRGMETDLVISPYASMLALPVRPAAVIQNLTYLTQLGAQGTYGLYEAIDYTPRHLSLGEEYAIVREYMVHHQGMILAALDNALNNNVLVRRFHADPHVQSYDLLLQERIPTHPVLRYPEAERDAATARGVSHSTPTTPWTVSWDTPQPYVHTLSNGHYSVLVSSTGGGYSQWNDTGLTRFMADAALDMWGNWVYVQEIETGQFWSASYAPTTRTPDEYAVHFSAHKVEFVRRDEDLSLKMDITVSPDDDVEIRRVALTNHRAESRSLFICDYAEVILTPQDADRRHPAFNKLFIQSEYRPDDEGLLFHRRPRSHYEQPIFILHRLITDPTGNTFDNALYYESDRTEFIGRGHTVQSPQALTQQRGNFPGNTGSTLDPIMALGKRVDLPPYATVQLAFLTIAADSREKITEIAGHYQAWNMIEQTFDAARYQSTREMRQLALEPAQLEQTQRLFSALVYPSLTMRAPVDTLAANISGQNGLWAYGISGDYPILLVKVSNADHLPLVQDLLQAHTYWRNRNQKITLVILNEYDAGYMRELYHQLHRLIVRIGSELWIGRHDGIIILNKEQLNSDVYRILLETSARVVLEGSDGNLAQQIKRTAVETTYLPIFRPTGSDQNEPSPPIPKPTTWLFDNGLGGFSADAQEYQIYLEPGQSTPAPWSNVIANADFGFLMTESGGGFTWGGNSSEFRLTAWRNDPVSDQPAEALYLRDEETADVWSPTPLPMPEAAPYLVSHGAGYSSFQHHSHGLEQVMTAFIAPDAPVKIVRLRIKNTWNHTRRITATYYAEWVLGTNRAMTGQYLIPEYDVEHHTLLARNPYSLDFGGHFAFLSGIKPFFGFTTDRVEFLGRCGTLSNPAALQRIGLAGTVEAGRDTCGVIQYHMDIPPGKTEEVVFIIGTGSSRAEALAHAAQFQDMAAIDRAWDDTQQLWDRLLRQVTVETPDAAINALMPWLLYQTIACRLWGRSAFYQSGGAFGFRDQLQDVMAVLHTAPELAREHILRAARHQFEAGDVLHWWHPPSGRGVRTRFSDDLIWLPFVVAQYVSVTGDSTILDEEVPFLRGERLKPDEDEHYGYYDATTETASIYEHCVRALDHGMTVGEHGLPLMGSGDWNDGMNRVGIEGKGESVWMGWFLYTTLKAYIEVCVQQGDEAQVEIYRQYMDDVQTALEGHAWDGSWYLRAFYDDGTPLGSANSIECKIDSIAQSWSVISGAANPERSRQAMAAVNENLVQEANQLILLFTPPFDQAPQDPGYIKGYVPGIRENGGQYTHAALWSIWAFALLRDHENVGRLLNIVNPVRHSDTPEKTAQYQVEPYVIAADVYSVEPHVGRGGWTWYTGSAGWMYRLILEMILGIQRQGNVLIINPVLPPDWDGFRAIYRFGGATYHIEVAVDRGIESIHIWLNDEKLPGNWLPLHDTQQSNRVVVKISAESREDSEQL